jgi:hypothetical protein
MTMTMSMMSNPRERYDYFERSQQHPIRNWKWNNVMIWDMEYGMGNRVQGLPVITKQCDDAISMQLLLKFN